MELILESGAKISVPSIDIDNYLTNLVEEAFKRQQSGAPASEVMAPVLGAPEAIIQRKCAAEWAADFTMQKHCLEQQKLATEKLAARKMTSKDQITIRAKCATDWPDDFTMRNHCEEQQLKALAEIRR